MLRFIITFIFTMLAFSSQGQVPFRLAVFGDSLSAGYNLRLEEAYPAQLEAALKAKGEKISVLNLGVSGDTTQSGFERLEWSINVPLDGVILELGANDALRGLPIETTRKNLEGIILALKAKNIKVLLCGMLSPPNLGKDYSENFKNMFEELAKKHDLLFYPFFLEGVAANPALNQKDGIHPTREGVAVIVEKTLPLITQFIQKP
jgi:acyl-CoA thioesterase I